MKHPLIPTLITTLLAFGLCTTITNGQSFARSVNAEDIERQSYVIGEHVFTRQQNASANYRGYIDTRMIMLAAKTISGHSLDDMKIYYRKADGSWVDGLSNIAIANTPDAFEIKYKNLSYNIPTPVLTATQGEVSTTTDGTGVFSYQLGISNSSSYTESTDDVTINAYEFFVKEADLEGNSRVECSDETKVTIGETSYCLVSSSENSDITFLADFGKTYHFVTRVKYTFDGQAGYSPFSDVAEVTAPVYYTVKNVSEVGQEASSAQLVKSGEKAILEDSERFGYIFDGYFAGRECTAEDVDYFSETATTYCFASDTAFDPESSISSDLVLIKKWTKIETKIDVAYTDLIGDLDGIATVYLGKDKLSDLLQGLNTETETYTYTVYDSDGTTILFDSTNAAVNMNEIKEKNNVKLVVTKTTGAGTELIATNIFEETNLSIIIKNENEATNSEVEGE